MAEQAEPIDFVGFYTASATRVVGYLYVVLGSVAEAEDAAQEAYTRAWLRWSRVQAYDDPEAWVRTVGFRVAMSAWRKTRNRLTAYRSSTDGATAGTGAHVADMSPDRLVVVDALRRIPAEQRRALVLFHMLGLTVAEIADETDAPVGTVKARLARGRKALAPYVSEFADDENAPPGSASSSSSPPPPSASASSSGEPPARFAKKGMACGGGAGPCPATRSLRRARAGRACGPRRSGPEAGRRRSQAPEKPASPCWPPILRRRPATSTCTAWSRARMWPG